ncbi:exodeoxyribonuclease VII large subunit [Candidatus Saccharibacteria bacterium]|nr:exodeoxyribonuclease VII large subunit [Candidatus Saccharibacteria bacterium]
MSDDLQMTPTEFVALANQTLEYAYSNVTIVGEVASFKVNQGKWVFFDLKDDETSVGCFMTLWGLRQPIEDGMKVIVRGTPKVTKWGKFSFTVSAIRPVGEGSLKKAYELLKKKLAGEGLFDPARKREIPEDLTRLGVISSTGAAGYADFIKIINARWGGMRVLVAHTQVQGLDAPDQMIRALKYFNERGEVQMIAMLRGGGSADDLSSFNDEALVRAVAASKIPVITGIGHEVDESLVDLAADVRASTPSNAAEMLTRDRAAERAKIQRAMRMATQAVHDNIHQAELANREKIMRSASTMLDRVVEPMRTANFNKIEQLSQKLQREMQTLENHNLAQQKILIALDPEKVLKQGYAIMKGEVKVGENVEITTFKNELTAEIKKISNREK